MSIALDSREPLDNFSKPYRQLCHLHKYVLVKVPNVKIDQLFPNPLPQVIPITPADHYGQVFLGDTRYDMSDGCRLTHLIIARHAMPWIGMHADTQYFSQGMSLAGRKCIVDLRVPIDGQGLNDFAVSILIMLSHHTNNNDWAPLHPSGRRGTRSSAIT